jgi:hypothetical protein
LLRELLVVLGANVAEVAGQEQMVFELAC